jgi:hypothetical protein
MNAQLAEQYGLTFYGANGIEVQRRGVQVAKFSDKKTQEENYQDALKWAREHSQEIGIAPGCECRYCKLYRGDNA